MSSTFISDKIPFREIPLFSELGEEQLRLISSISKVKKYGKNEIIFLSGEKYKGFFIVLKGNVKVYKMSSSCKETILHIIKPYNMFADVPLFEGKDYPVNAQTLNESELLFVPREEFIHLLETNTSICLKMLAGFAKRMKLLTQKVDELTNKEVVNRLAEYLLNEAVKGSKLNTAEPVIRLNLSKSAIASYLGTITETLSRSFRKLQDENLIIVEGKKIIIKDYSGLKKLTSG